MADFVDVGDGVVVVDDGDVAFVSYGGDDDGDLL